MLAKKEDLLSRIKSDILAIEPSAEIILFGSRARGDAREDSDWDLLVLVDGEVDRKRKKIFNSKMFRVDLDYETTISAFLKSNNEWATPFEQASPFYHNVKEEGIYI